MKKTEKANDIQKRIYLSSLTVESTANNICLIGEIPTCVNIVELKKFLEIQLNNISDINIHFFDKNGSVYYEQIGYEFEIELIHVNEFNYKDHINLFDLNDRLYRCSIIKTDAQKRYLFLEFHHILIDEEGISSIIKILNGEIDYKSVEITNKKDTCYDFNDNSYIDTTLLCNSAKIPLQIECLKIDHKCQNKYIEFNQNELELFEKATFLGYSNSIICSFSLAKLISIYSKNDTVSFGIIFNTRSQQQINQIGMFANNVPLIYQFNKIDIKEEISNYEDFYYNLFENYDFDISKINIDNLSQQIRTLFVSQLNSCKKIKKYEIKLETVDMPESEFDFVVEKRENTLKITYNTNIFSLKHIDNIVTTYKNIIINTLELLLEGHSNCNINLKQSIFKGCQEDINRTKVFDAFKKTPESNIIIEDKLQKISKNDVLKITSKLNQYLKKEDIDELAICLDRTAYLPALTLSCFLLNKKFVIIDKKIPMARQEYILKDSKIASMICDNMDYSVEGVKKINLDDILLMQSEENYYEINESENNGFICYTSGTSGTPKGVNIKRNSIMNMLVSSNKTLGFSTKTRGICIANTTFDMYYAELLLVVLNGGYVYILDENEQNDTKEFTKVINQKNITTMFITPSRFNVFIRLNLLPIFNNYETICFGGEDIKFDLKSLKRFLPNTKLFNLYGPTETTFYVTEKELVDNNISLGSPVINTEIRLLDSNNRVVNIYEEGEIVVFGENVTDGYIGYNSEQFLKIDGIWAYKTGDFAKVDEHNNLVYLGRRDNQIKIRGQRLDLSELENLLQKNERIPEHLINIKDNEIYLAVQLVSGYSFDMLRNDILSNLPAYFCPRYIVPITEVATTINGKSVLNQITFEENTLDRLEVEDKNQLEKIKDIVCTALDIEVIENDTSLISIGVDSLKALEISGLLQQCGIDITAFEILKFQTPIEILRSKYSCNGIDIAKESYIDSVPIFNFYFMRNSLNEKFNMCFDLKVNHKFDLENIKENLDIWCELSSILNYTFEITQSKVKIFYNTKKANYIVKVYEDTINDDMLRYDINNNINIAKNQLIFIVVYKKGNEWHLGFNIHHFIIDAFGIQYIIDELTNVFDNKPLKNRNSFIENQLSFRKEYEENKIFIEKFYDKIFENDRYLSIDNEGYFQEKKVIFSKNQLNEVSRELNISKNILILSLIIFSFEGFTGEKLNVMVEKQGHRVTNSFGWCTKIGIISEIFDEYKSLNNIIKKVTEHMRGLETEGYNYVNWLNEQKEGNKEKCIQLAYNYMSGIFKPTSNFELINLGGNEALSEKISFGTIIDINVIDETDLTIHIFIKQANKNFANSFIENLKDGYSHLVRNYKKPLFKASIFAEKLITSKLENTQNMQLLPLTYMQKNILKKCIIDDNTTSAKISLTYKITIDIDVKKFNETIMRYIEINEYLSSKLIQIDNDYFLSICDRSNHFFEFTELDENSDLMSEFDINMEILNDLYIKFKIVKYKDDHYITIVANHILLDGMSVEYIISDLINGYIDNKKLIDRTYNMLEYGYWINAENQTRNLNKFMKKLDSIKYKIPYISHKNCSDKENNFFVKKSEKLSKDFEIKNYCLNNQLTVSNFMHAVYCLTKQLTNNIDITLFNAIDFGRNISKYNLSENVGMFINRRIYIGYDSSNNMTIHEWINKFIQSNFVQPEELFFDVNKLGIEGKVDLFGYENFSQNTFILPKEKLELNLVDGNENFDIDFNFRILGNREISVDYNANTINSEYVVLLINNFQKILNAILSNVDGKDLDYLRGIISLYEPSPHTSNTNITNSLKEIEFIDFIWLKVTGGDENNFVLAGGDSLKAMELVNTINNKYNINISTHSFLENPTKKFLYDLLSMENKDINADSEYIVSYSQKRVFSDILINENHLQNLLLFDIELPSNYTGNIIDDIVKVIENNIGIFTRFKYYNEEIYQYIKKCKPNDYIFVADNEISRLAEMQIFAKNVDVLEDVLFKVILNKPLDKMLLIVSHTICDGKSLEIIKNDFINLFYDNQLFVHNDILDYLKIRKLASESYTNDKLFNKYAYSKAPKRLQQLNNNGSKCLIIEIEEHIQNLFKEIQISNISYNTIFFAAIVKTLKEQGFSSLDVVLNGRTLNHSEDVFGMLTNIVPFNIQDTIDLKQIQNQFLDCVYLQYYDFEKINAEQNDFLYIYQPIQMEINEVDDEFTSHVPVAFEVINNTHFRIAYSENYYISEDVDRFISYYNLNLEKILKEIIEGEKNELN